MQMNRFVQLHDKFSCAFFWRLNYIKLSVAVLFFVSGKYNYKLRGTERGNVQLHEFKFNRIIFFDGCKMDISLSAPNHHHKLIIIVSIDLQFDVAFFINTGLRLSVLLSLSLSYFFSFAFDWNRVSNRVRSKLKWFFNAWKWMLLPRWRFTRTHTQTQVQPNAVNAPIHHE